MSNVKEWLDSLGLGEYAEAFRENAIDWELVPRLDQQILKDIGVKAAGHRIRLLDAAGQIVTAEEPQAQEPSASGVRPRLAASEAERRQLTVMFCDLVGSTTLSQSMDPEEYREVLSAYQSAAREVIEQYDGYIARYMGDGLLVYFGYPQAHEEDSERAIRAGLGIVDRVGRLDVRDNIELQVRVGIATGLVVAGDIVGEGASEERAVLGDTPNLAARLQGLALPGQILTDDTTRRLVGNTLEMKDLGGKHLKGFSETCRAWCVVGEGSADSRFDASHALPPTDLVGREHELGLLMDRWNLAKGGEGQVVLLSGEAGIGKSRMVQAIRDQLRDERHFRLLYQCSPHHTNSAFHPIIQRLERAAGFSAGDCSETKLDKLEALLKPTTDSLDTIAPLFAALLSLPGESRYGALNLTSQQRRDRTFAALINQVVELSRRSPVLFVVEDAHWIDPTSQDLVSEISAGITDAAVLVLITYRPDYSPPRSGHPHLTSLSLSRLSRDQGAEIVRGVAENMLSGAVVDRIIARADGVPLFVEELTRSVMEADLSVDDLSVDARIPATLQASLTARLDRLGEAREIAQIGAAIGREYTYEVIRAVAPELEIGIDAALDQLIGSGLVLRTVTTGRTVYVFKHALVQEAAYESMLKSKRLHLHRHIVAVLEADFPSIAETSPEILARHCTEGRMAKPAIAYWQRAGESCAGLSANVEAVNHFTEALKLVATLPESRERDEIELKLQVALGGPLLMTKGPGAPAVEGAFSRARELSHKVGDTIQLVPALFGLWRHFIGLGDCRVTRDLGRELLDLSESAGDTTTKVVGHYALGYTLFCHGDLEEAHTLLEDGHKLYDRRLRESLAFRIGQDPGVACLSYGSLALWVLGYPDTASRGMQAALSLANSLSHPFSRAYAYSLACQVYQLRCEVETVLEMSDVAIGISREQGFPVWLASPTIFRGWARSRHGEAVAGVDEMDQAVQEICAAGMQMRRPLYLALLAEGNMLAGRTGEAKLVIEEAFEVIDRTGEHWPEAELCRLSGEILAREDQAAAEVKFVKAIDIAHSQNAKSWELRAAVSLARLRRAQGRSHEAVSALEPVYSWFTEGFGDSNLKDAKESS